MRLAHIKITGGQNDITIVQGTDAVTENSSLAITFPYALPHIPVVTVTPVSEDTDHQATVSGITTGGFTIYMNKSGGGGADDIEVNWMAVS